MYEDAFDLYLLAATDAENSIREYIGLDFVLLLVVYHSRSAEYDVIAVEDVIFEAELRTDGFLSFDSCYQPLLGHSGHPSTLHHI